MKKLLAGINILIVEDDQMLREIIVDSIQDSGANVFEAENGLIGFQIIEKEKIDFVLSDIQMPVMDGVELLKKIRIRHSENPLVMFVTGQCNITAENAIEFGASDLMQKPFRINEVLAKIEHLLQAAKII